MPTATTFNTTNLQSKLQKIKKTLTIPTNATLKYKYRKVCLDDDRPSAVSIGYILGVGVLVVAVTIIILQDLPVIFRTLKYGFGH